MIKLHCDNISREITRTTISLGCKSCEIFPQTTISHSFVRYYTRTTISHGWRFLVILHHIPNIPWLQILWDITPDSKYLMVGDFVRYYTRTPISHGCRFREILHQNYNISWLEISWDITPEPQYLMVADFVRYYTRTTSHGRRILEILH